MVKFKNIVLLGTSHIAAESVKEIEVTLDREKPEFVALELDKQRLKALMGPVRRSIRFSDISRVGVKGFLFALLGSWAEKKLGSQVGVTPGVEMKKAVELAQKNDMKIALIDQRIEKTLKRISALLTWKEKWRFVVDIFRAVVLRKQDISFDLRKVPSTQLITKMVSKVRERYPSLYQALIEDRNKVMALKLQHLMDNYPDKKILVIVGAGHVEGMLTLLRKS